MLASNLWGVTNESAANIFLQNPAQQEGNQDDFLLGPNHAITCPPGQIITPYAENADQFAQNHLLLSVGDRLFCIWQQRSSAGDERIRYATDGKWSPPSSENILPGTEVLTRQGHPYRLVISADGHLQGALLTPEEAAGTPEEAVDANLPDDPAAAPEGTMIDQIYQRLLRDRPQFSGITYGKAEGNILGGSWLLQTPQWWGKAASALPVDHSHSLGTEVREMIVKAEQTVDITLLYHEPRDGWFLECIAKGIGALVAKDREITVRILIGNYPTKIADTTGLLKNIEKWSPRIKGSKLRIFAAGMMVLPTSWNHAKIIAVDGRWAMVGGHNLWWEDYLCAAPVHDLSMQVEGSAAYLAHNYCNRLWEHVSYWNRRAIGIYANDYDGRTGRIGRSSLSRVAPRPTRVDGSTTILAVGRTAAMDWGRGNQSDHAFLHALSLAKSSIKLSQQDLLLLAVGDPRMVAALCEAVLRNVKVSIVLTTPGAASGAGTGYTTGASIEVVLTTIVGLTVSIGAARGIPRNRVVQLLLENLKVAPIRFSPDREWPAERAYDQCGQPRVARKIANHAKLWIVDDRLFYIGSQNIYPSDNQEYGWIVEGESETAQLLSQYWNPLWHWSSQHLYELPSNLVADVPESVNAT